MVKSYLAALLRGLEGMKTAVAIMVKIIFFKIKPLFHEYIYDGG